MLDRALILLARSLLRVCSPGHALVAMRVLAGALPSLRTPREVRRVAHELRGRGTCLSRSLAIAARSPDARIVIGVEPRRSEPLFAHAWLEMDGHAVDPAEPRGEIIARLPADCHG